MTTIQLSLPELLSVLGGLITFFIGALWLFGQIIVRQFKAGMDERFERQDEKRETGAQALRDLLKRHIEAEAELTSKLSALERDFLTLRGDLPLQYVRREDYVRNQTIIESKLDGLALRLEAIILKGATHGRSG
jgi:hypothetical protein